MERRDMRPRKRRICYVTGTRADFGLMQSTLQQIAKHPSLALSLVVTGTHLSGLHGSTITEILDAGLPVDARIEVDLSDSTGATMARNIGIMISGFVPSFERLRPDIVLLLGDRGEMLAAALAAIHLNIPLAHIHGGERSGTVDEPIRHAISKLSHLHFVSSDEARARLVRMGEREDRVIVTGAPGLDGLAGLATLSRKDLCASIKLDEARPITLMVFHPVLQEAERSGDQVREVLKTLLASQTQVVALMPNSDAGSALVRTELERMVGHPDVRISTHMPRPEFVSWMATCDVMVGNSSSGIIEAATFGTPVVNLGIRQNLRQRNDNVTDVAVEADAFRSAIQFALQRGRFDPRNVYGDGSAGIRIVENLATLSLSKDLLLKANTY